MTAHTDARRMEKKSRLKYTLFLLSVLYSTLVFHVRVLLFIGNDARDRLNVAPVLADFTINLIRAIHGFIILLHFIHLSQYFQCAHKPYTWQTWQNKAYADDSLRTTRRDHA